MSVVRAYRTAEILNKESPESQLKRHIQALWTVAKNQYGIREQHDFKVALMNNQSIRKLKGCGHAASGGVIRTIERTKPLILLRLNKDAVEQNLTLVLSDVIPHEMAHVVCLLRPEQGTGHDIGWQAVCRTLGGTGEARYPVGAFNL